MMAADLARALDPALLAADADVVLDPWQASFVRSTSPQTIMLVPRQCGKTESAVIKALSVCNSEPDSLALIVAPAQRLSDEFVLRARKSYNRIKDASPLANDAARRLEFANASRILALPGDNDGDTLRGLANVRLAIIDEASRCSDALIAAIRPMLAINPRAQLVYLSTPNGKRGAFYETWVSNDPDWDRIRIDVTDCPRITPEFLARERKNLGEARYSEEYGLEFIDSDTAAFPSDMIAAAFNDPGVLPLWN